MERETIGVVLLAMGGPDTLDAVEPFLANLLGDPLIWPLPGRRLLAPVIARRRARVVRAYYARIGGGSPLIATTERQTAALEEALASPGPEFRVYAAFRYWGPDARSAVARAREAGAARLIALPMYPQYCAATSLTSLLELRRAAAEAALPVREIDRFSDDPAWLDALAAPVRDALAAWPPGPQPHVVLSAHGVPERLRASGDPYVGEVEATARGLLSRLPPVDATLSYQSRMGPLRWVGPATDETLRRLGARGVRDVLMVPLTFVADHVETLDEMDIRLRAIGRDAGVRRFVRVPALNDAPAFIDALAALVRRRAEAA